VIGAKHTFFEQGTFWRMAASDEDKDAIGCIPLERMNSVLTAATPYNLAEAVKEDNLRLFVSLLRDVDANDLDSNIVHQNHMTLMQVLAKSGKTEFLRQLLNRHNASVGINVPHQVLQKFPIHFAAEEGHHEMVRLLLESGADVNARMGDGTTPLHLLAMRSGAEWIQDNVQLQRKLRKNFVLATQFVLQRRGVIVDAKNDIGAVPLYFAAESGSVEVIRLLLASGACVTVEVDDEPVEDFIRNTKPEALDGVDLSRNRINRNTFESELFQLLFAEPYHPGQFRAEWEKANNNRKVNVEADNGTFTFLQYCCDQGHADLVKFLLDQGADPNAFCASYRIPPFLLAAAHGYYKVMEVFRDFGGRGKVKVDFCAVDTFKANVFHKVLAGESKAHVNARYRDYGRCLDVLLDPGFVRKVKPAINGQDQLGNSPLHLAAQLGKVEAVRSLLSNEANIGLKNYRGETPIAHIPPAVMRDFLDECLASDGLASDQQFKLTFKYSFLGPPLSHKMDALLDDDHDADTEEDESKPKRHDCQTGNPSLQDLPEAEPLWYMAQMPDHKNLLTHPVIASFLCLKWRRIRPYYYVNLFSYLAFVGCLTGYLVQMNVDLAKAAPEATFGDSLSGASLGLLHVTAIFLIFLSLRELFQALVSFRRYIFNLENILELTMIAISYYLISGGDGLKQDLVTTRSLSATVILLSWAEMMLLLGRHPRLSTFIAMLFKVSYNFLLFLTWYISIIVAFGLAFFVILKRPEVKAAADTGDKSGGDGDDPPNAYFASPEKSLLKTVVMSLTGEIEFEGIDFESEFGKVLFLVYVFFVMLVLVNLLNGLAVSDITEIQKEAEVVAMISRVELVAFIESMLLGDPFQFLTNWPPFKWGQRLPACDCLQTLYRRRAIRNILNCLIGPTLLFTDRLTNKRAVFYPNKSARERSSEEEGGGERGELPGPRLGLARLGFKDNLVMDENILESAKALVVSRQESDKMEELQAKMIKIEKGLLLLAKQQNLIIEKLNGS